MNEFHKAFLAHDEAYHYTKGLANRTISIKILKDRGYEIARNLKYDGYKRGLTDTMYKIFGRGSGASVNEYLPEELHKPVIKKFKRSRVCVRFKDNIWGTYLAEMGSLSSFNHGVKHILFVINGFTKYAWVTLKIRHKKYLSLILC